MKHFVLPIVFHLSTLSVVSSRKCLTDVSVTEISSEQANLTWAYQCEEALLSGFKIYYKHLKYLACQDAINDGKRHPEIPIRSIEANERHRIIGDEKYSLAPHSEYEFKVKALFKRNLGRSSEELLTTATTDSGIPNVNVKVKGTESRSDEITFLLNEIDENNCDHFKSELGFIRYELKGRDPWNKDEDLMDFVSINARRITIKGLSSFSNYGLKLYVTDKYKRYLVSDSDDSFDFLASTKSEQPSIPPDNVRIEVQGYECAVSWSDPQPPQGQVEFYQIKYRKNDESWQQTEKFQDVIEVIGDQRKLYKFYVGPNVTKLDASVQLYVRDFTIGSGYSDVVQYGESSDQGLDMVSIIVIAGTLLLVIIVIAVFASKRCNMVRRFQGFERTKSSDYSERPIIRDPRLPSNNGTSPNRPTSQGSSSLNNSSDVELRIKGNRASLGGGRRSGFDPLPHVPGENIYNEIGEPQPHPMDEENYLVPNPVKVASVESLDEEGYLKPNFNRVQPFDTRSPSKESPEPIPMVSYASQDQLASS